MRVESKWIEAFAELFRRCGVVPGTTACLLSETQSRRINVELSELALLQLGANMFHVVMPTPRQSAPVPVRSTGASDAMQGNAAAVRALAACDIVVDCTVEGLLHAEELKAILAGGARLIMISNEHPEVLERIGSVPGLDAAVRHGRALIQAATTMHVTSAHGTDFRVDLREAVVGGNWGWCTDPGTRSHWPGGLVACFPRAGSASGRVVLAPGDVNLTFKRYLERPVTLVLEGDYVVSIEGDGLDAELMRSYFAAWGDREAYAISHVGWGMNPRARWDALTMYDRGDVNGTELRTFAGNFLISTGANEHANRYTRGHFDLPMRGCSISLDGRPVVTQGRLIHELEVNQE